MKSVLPIEDFVLMMFILVICVLKLFNIKLFAQKTFDLIVLVENTLLHNVAIFCRQVLNDFQGIGKLFARDWKSTFYRPHSH